VSRHGEYFAELFSGVGQVAKAARRSGFASREWDIKNGPKQDLTRPAVVRQIAQDAQKGLLVAAMLGTRCTSFSRARDRTFVIRSPAEAWGCNNLDGTSARDLASVESGSRTLSATLTLIRILNKHKSPYIEENPHSSKIWYVPELARALQQGGIVYRAVDFCSHKTAWRKRTLLACCNMDPQDSEILERTCHGRQGFCSFSKKKHWQLTGSNGKGVPRTLVAQPYPTSLARDLAKILLAGPLAFRTYNAR